VIRSCLMWVIFLDIFPGSGGAEKGEAHPHASHGSTLLSARVIDVHASIRRDSEAARRFLHRARTTTGVVPVEVVTDPCPACQLGWQTRDLSARPYPRACGRLPRIRSDYGRCPMRSTTPYASRLIDWLSTL
jgi:hypothetical protein